MTTLYIRDVPSDVAETLKQRAATQGQSLSAYVATQLTAIAARPTNAEVVARLRTRNRESAPGTADIVEELEAGRR